MAQVKHSLYAFRQVPSGGMAPGGQQNLVLTQMDIVVIGFKDKPSPFFRVQFVWCRRFIQSLQKRRV